MLALPVPPPPKGQTLAIAQLSPAITHVRGGRRDLLVDFLLAHRVEVRDRRPALCRTGGGVVVREGRG